MSVQMLFPRNPLAAQLRAPGGLKVSEAMARAEINLQHIRGACIDALHALLADVEARFDAYPGGYDEQAVGNLYDVVSKSFGVAGAFGFPAVDTALASFCVLLDNLKLRRAWDGDAVMVHVRSLRLLVNAARMNVDNGVEAVIEGLGRVSARYAPEG